VPGCIDEIELVALAVFLGRVIESDRLGLDRDAALAFEFERVEHLILHFAGLEAAANLDEAVGQRGFAVIDVGDDREVAYPVHRVGRPAAEPAEERNAPSKAPAKISAGL
jgi:hypothetical protein